MTYELSRLKLIVPDWDDLVDPDFNFTTEEHSPNYRRDRYRFGARIWDIFENPPLDGVLVSLSIIEPKMSKIRKEGGLRRFLHLEGKKLELIADCGAWQYRYEDKPRYTPKEALDMYEELGVDYGVSVDHIAFFGNSQERIKITLQYAEEGYELWKKGYEKGDYNFKLLASVQGIDINDYMKNMERLYKRGFRYFAIGGLARRSSEFISKLANALKRKLRNEFKDIEKIHFLGIARPKLILHFKELAEYVNDLSFDNATYLRAAWMRHIDNYITLNGKAYTAIRVRMGTKDDKELLDVLRVYDNDEVDLEKVLPKLREYVVRIGDVSYLPYYIETLKDKPWKDCKCPICSKIGVDVIIFRGNDRNRRRGFHNLHVFYTLLKTGKFTKDFTFSIPKPNHSLEKLVPATEISENNYIDEFINEMTNRGIDLRRARKILILTHCTAAKNVNNGELMNILRKANIALPSQDIERENVYRELLKQFMKPAKDMYKGTFSIVRKIYDYLRSKGKDVDLYIISARYGLISGDDVIIPYDATLKGLGKDKIEAWSIKMKIPSKILNLISDEYDLIIAILPKEYAYALNYALRYLMRMNKVILILPTTLVSKAKEVKALILPGGSLTRRIKSLNLLYEALKRMLNSSRNLLDFMK